MKTLAVLTFLGEMGIRWTNESLEQALDYVDRMIKDERVIRIDDDNGIHTVIFFAVCESYDPFYKKETWEYKSHDPDGTTLYVEKAASRGWSKDLRNKVRELILSQYPDIQTWRWHRWGKKSDRAVVVHENKGVYNAIQYS